MLFQSKDINITIASVAPAPDGFSTENVPGTYDAATFMWTPGRGSDGRVTQASWNLIPNNTWVEVAGTRLDALEPALLAALPGYNDPGSASANGLGSLPNTYSGLAVDINGNRAWCFGGGHYDSGNNGLYRFDLWKFAWAIEKLPDFPANWDPGYGPPNTAFTTYTQSVAYLTANPSASDVSPDQFYDPVRPLANTRNPTGRHTYSNLDFDPVRQRVVMGCYTTWFFDLASKTWANYRQFTGTTVQAFQDGKAFYDATDNILYNGPRETSTPGGYSAFNDNTKTFTTVAWLPSGWDARRHCAARHQAGRKAYLFAAPSWDYYEPAWPPRLVVCDFAAKTATNVTMTGLVKASCGHSTRTSMTVMTYVSAWGKCMLFMPYDINGDYPSGTPSSIGLKSQVFLIDPVTGVTKNWPMLPGKTTFLDAGRPSALYSRLVYMPQLHAIVVCDDGDKNWYLLKLGAEPAL